MVTGNETMTFVKLAAVQLAVGLGWAMALTAQAQGPVAYNVTENQSLYGHLIQLLTTPAWPDAPDNDCAAVTATNSFVYLQNEYPSIYGQALVPDNDTSMVSPARPSDFDGRPCRQFDLYEYTRRV